jgi:hypothetical protein
MKKLLILLLLTSSFVYSRGGGGSHVSSSHVSESTHVSSEHINSSEHEVASYNHVSESETSSRYTRPTYINENEIHSFSNNNHMLYYYLIMNHHTNKCDTITAETPDALREKINETTQQEDDNPITLTDLYMFGAFILFIIGVVAAFFTSK